MRKKFFITLVLILVAIILIIGGVSWNSHRTAKKYFNDLKVAATKYFHDPESTRFRSVQLQSLEGTIFQKIKDIEIDYLIKNPLPEIISIINYNPKYLELCGEINSKNRFGAYVGYQYFHISGNGQVINIDTSSDFSKKLCAISSDSIIYAE